MTKNRLLNASLRICVFVYTEMHQRTSNSKSTNIAWYATTTQNWRMAIILSFSVKKRTTTEYNSICQCHLHFYVFFRMVDAMYNTQHFLLMVLNMYLREIAAIFCYKKKERRMKTRFIGILFTSLEYIYMYICKKVTDTQQTYTICGHEVQESRNWIQYLLKTSIWLYEEWVKMSSFHCSFFFVAATVDSESVTVTATAFALQQVFLVQFFFERKKSIPSTMCISQWTRKLKSSKRISHSIVWLWLRVGEKGKIKCEINE